MKGFQYWVRLLQALSSLGSDPSRFPLTSDYLSLFSKVLSSAHFSQQAAHIHSHGFELSPTWQYCLSLNLSWNLAFNIQLLLLIRSCGAKFLANSIIYWTHETALPVKNQEVTT